MHRTSVELDGKPAKEGMRLFNKKDDEGAYPFRVKRAPPRPGTFSESGRFPSKAFGIWEIPLGRRW
jgi:hypothetical protein